MEPRVVADHRQAARHEDDPDPAIKAMLEQFLGPGHATAAARCSSTARCTGDGHRSTSRDVHAAEIPAANGITNARSLAKVYAATMAPVDGVQLLDDDVRERGPRHGHAGRRARRCA